MKKVQPNWQSADWVKPFTIKITGEKAKSENCLSVFSIWDNDSLYFFFKVTDTDLRAYQTEKDNAKLYLDDMLEVLIDTQNKKDSCWGENDIIYHVNILGIKKDDRGNKNCLSDPNWDGKAGILVQLLGTMNDSTDIDKGYLITLSFPWEELSVKPHKGLTMGINFANGDNDGKGRQLYDWVGAWPMRSPYAFGDLILR
ncbi:MAG: sugar-binding protein [Bacteroidota bacterium]